MNDDPPDPNVDSPSSSSGFKRHFDLVDIFTSRLSMGPRKKSKSDLEDASKDSSPVPQTDPNGDVTMTDAPSTPKPISTTKPLENSTTEARSSWYSTWTTKSRPVTEVVKDSAVSVASSPAASSTNLPSTPMTRKMSARNLSVSEDTPSPKRHFAGSIKGPARSTPLAAAVSNVSITSNKSETKVSTDEEPAQSNPVVKEPAPLPPEPASIPTSAKTEPVSERPKSSSGWFGGWWSRPDGYDPKAKEGSKEESKEEQVLEEAKNKPLPAATPSESPEQSKLISNGGTDTVTNTLDKSSAPGPKPATDDSKSWFGLWSKAQNVKTMLSSIDKSNKPTDTASEANVPPPDDPNVVAPPVTSDQMPKDANSSIKDGRDNGKRKPSGWAFWSKESKETGDKTGDGSVLKQVGELAVADTPSQTNPEAAQFNEIEEQKPKKDIKPRKGRGRPKVTKDEILLPSSSKTTPSSSPVPGKTKDLAKVPKVDVPKNNLLLPEFSKTYSLVQQPSIWQQLKDYFVGGELQHPHLHILPSPPRIKKALALGVHGFFPGVFFQSLFGPPTGTSIRFANNAAAAIKAWTEAHGYECEIEKVALEGEGLIADRVDTLWKLLLNWIDHVRSADLILVACHSQGVPVSIMLVEKLIEFKCIGPSTRIGICAMAGVNMGPFLEYKTQILGKSALELFDFCNQNSKVSKMYLTALEGVLKHGVKIVYIGSIDDQLVSVDSSTFSNVSHPCIYRAVFIDGRLFTSDFITELVGFALKLRNLGLPDHGLIRELSPALAGSLVGGEGHSRLYDSIDLYALAVRHTLETTTPYPLAPIVKTYEGPAGSKDASGSSNPFFLPWAMRGILEEDKVRKELGDECARLLTLFEDWKPMGKGLKDVKFRLEALRSKL